MGDEPVASAMTGGERVALDRESVEGLLKRMRVGDREAAAEFLQRYGSRLRRRIRGRLGPGVRRVFDSQDIMSTLGRRLDGFIASGRFDAETDAELWGLVFRMADNALVDKLRVFQRLQRVESEDTAFANEMRARLERSEKEAGSGVEVELDRLVRSLEDEVDRRIMEMWLLGVPHKAAAEDLGLSAAAVRKRWQRIKAELKPRIESERSA